MNVNAIEHFFFKHIFLDQKLPEMINISSSNGAEMSLWFTPVSETANETALARIKDTTPGPLGFR